MRIVLRNVLLLCMLVPIVLACATTSTTDAPVGPNKKAAVLNAQLGARYLGQGELKLADEKLRRAFKTRSQFINCQLGVCFIATKVRRRRTCRKTLS